MASKLHIFLRSLMMLDQAICIHTYTGIFYTSIYCKETQLFFYHVLQNMRRHIQIATEGFSLDDLPLPPLN